MSRTSQRQCQCPLLKCSLSLSRRSCHAYKRSWEFITFWLGVPICPHFPIPKNPSSHPCNRLSALGSPPYPLRHLLPPMDQEVSGSPWISPTPLACKYLLLFYRIISSRIGKNFQSLVLYFLMYLRESPLISTHLQCSDMLPPGGIPTFQWFIFHELRYFVKSTFHS